MVGISSFLILQQPGEPLRKPHFEHLSPGLQQFSDPLISPQ